MSRVALLVIESGAYANLSTEVNALFTTWQNEGTIPASISTVNGQPVPYALVVDKTETPESVKAKIDATRAACPSINHVFCFGSVPVPSIGTNAWDGHPDHATFWSNHSYYTIDGPWTRGSIQGGSGDHTLEGFLASFAPNTPWAAVGSINFANIDVFAPLTEIDLLRGYLNRRNAYGVHRAKNYGLGCVVQNTFGSGYDNDINILLKNNIDKWFPNRNSVHYNPTAFAYLGANPTIFAFCEGPGNGASGAEFGNSWDVAKLLPEAVFMFTFASWIGDLQTYNNLVRCLVAGKCLYCVWDCWNELDLQPLLDGASIGEMWLKHVTLYRDLPFDPQGDPTLTTDYKTWAAVADKVNASASRLDSLEAITPSIKTTSADGNTTVQFFKSDSTTQGSWTGVYGAQGYMIPTDTSNHIPPYVTFNASGQSDFLWNGNTTDVRGLIRPEAPTTRIASCSYSTASFSYDLTFSDGKEHEVALYCMDWDGYGAGGRKQTITIVDPITQTVMNTRHVINFGQGVWLCWRIKGHVSIVITNDNSNAVVNGVFFN